MAYRLRFDEPVGVGIRRVCTEQLTEAAALLRDSGEDRAHAVHEARKSVKKTRAALRLARSSLDRQTYRGDMAALRDAARRLSGARDADVMLETVEKLADGFAGRLPAKAFDTLGEEIERQLADSRAGDPDSDAADALQEIAGRVEQWPLDDARWGSIRADATRLYARGRCGEKGSRGTSEPEPLHEWRKRVKDLWYVERLLRDAWPGVLKAEAKEADRLGELLGEDHDLAVLADFAERHPESTGPLVDLAELDEMIEQRRSELQAEAQAIGRRLYAEKRKAFDARLKRLIRAARDEHAVAGPVP
jgi:CHAD domain-containing protein